MNETRLNRRDMLLMTSGAAALCLGRLADGVIPSASGDSTELSSATQRLSQIPAEFGSWTSSDGTISEREQRVASIQGYVRREYHNHDSGYQVGMTLLCGPAGPMAVHPPTACFEGVGYEPLSGPMLTSIARPDQSSAHRQNAVLRDEFNKATFRQDESSMTQAVRVFWGWSSNGDWTAPARPRVAFRGSGWLYKLYVTDRSALRPGAPVVPQCETFLGEVLPILRQHLADIPPSSAPAV